MPPADLTVSPEGAWFIATCPNCSCQVKAREEILQLALALACPHCDSSLDIKSNPSESEPAKTQYATPQPLQEPSKGIRRRRKSRKKILLTWDLEESSKDEDTVTDSEDNEIKPIEVKRVKRRGSREKEQNKIYRVITGSSILIISSGGIILLVFLMYKSIATITRDITQFNEISNMPIEVQEKINAPKPITANLTVEEREKCMEIIQTFCSAVTLEEKVALVRHPEKTAERIKGTEYGPRKEKYTRVAYSKKQVIDELHIISLLVKVTDENKYRFFAFEQTAEAIKMDWEISFGYQPMPLSTFKNTRPESPQEFRANLRSGDYYANKYSDQGRWQCIEVYYMGNPEFRVFSYVDRQSEVGKELISKLAPDPGIGSLEEPKERLLSVIVALKFDPLSNADNQVEIVKLIQDHWFR